MRYLVVHVVEIKAVAGQGGKYNSVIFFCCVYRWRFPVERMAVVVRVHWMRLMDLQNTTYQILYAQRLPLNTQRPKF